jgi:quercetin dioxygenase-like cupin family protein
MEIIRNSGETTVGPSDWFRGTVYIDPIASVGSSSRVVAHRVRFTPGARTAWHSHPLGQSVYVDDGQVIVQRRGAPLEVIAAGEQVMIEAGEEHWQGTAPGTFATTIDIQAADESGETAVWCDHVSDEEYAAALAM